CSIFAVSLCCLVWCYCLSLCFFFSYVDPSDLHSFPTRRSSDLPARSLLGACRVTTFSALGFTSTESSFLGSLAELSYNSTVPPETRLLPLRTTLKSNPSSPPLPLESATLSNSSVRWTVIPVLVLTGSTL